MTDLNIISESGEGAGATDWLRLAATIAATADQTRPIHEVGRRLGEFRILSSREGVAIPRLFGRMRLGGQLIWHSDVTEHSQDSVGGGDKGTGDPSPTQRDYHYTMSFAIALCEGEVARIGRIWADGKRLEKNLYPYRLYRGTATQMPDAAIEAVLGTGKACAFRNTAYVVFQDFPISDFGDRIPQFSFEVLGRNAQFTDLIRAVDILPGATEFGYDPQLTLQHYGVESVKPENYHAEQNRSDWEVSLDDLQESCPNCKWVALVVTWFGTDLRAAHCKLQPRVENRTKTTYPQAWSVLGRSRAQVPLVSMVDGRPAFGSTPSDDSVKRAIADLKARGLKVMFYPFIMMDIPSSYPWRGRIACSSDGTSTARAEITSFVNGANSQDPYCLRGMVAHYAQLCVEAGGVDAFLLASEMRGLSRTRDNRNRYPFAELLRDLARLVRAKLPDTKISYAADWSEYNGYYREGNNLDFPLDDFWSDSNCDFVGIDAYFPLSDWRDGAGHLDATRYAGIYDLAYLKSQVEGGEYYDYYYANKADRDAQNRRSITDGLGEPWLHRQKDIRNWWGNFHYTRRNGARYRRTRWRPQSKPIWFTEIGCPAVNKGSNQPNMFPDTVSVEGGLPYYSDGTRDDHMQRQYLRAIIEHYTTPANNPTSIRYGAPMVSRDHMFIWAWDARPFPAFPYRVDIWADGGNWHTGHWLNGRLSGQSVGELITALSNNAVDVSGLDGLSEFVEGYVVDAPSTPRNLLDAMRLGFGVDIISTDNVTARHRQAPPQRVIDTDDIVGAAPRITRQPRRDSPHILRLNYISADGEYERRIVEARQSSTEGTVQTIELPLILTDSQARHMPSVCWWRFGTKPM